MEIDNYIEDKKIEAEIDDEVFDYEKARMRGLKVAYRKLDQNLMSFERFVEIYKRLLKELLNI